MMHYARSSSAIKYWFHENDQILTVMEYEDSYVVSRVPAKHVYHHPSPPFAEHQLVKALFGKVQISLINREEPF